MGKSDYISYKTAWCPGCGNFSILNALKSALIELDKKPHEVLIVGGIGQAAKTPQYLNTNGFCGLHGRALPPAVAAKIVNKDLTVIINTGDGDSYGEGGNHLLHNIRRNVDVTHFVHDNQIYGLTKGQASPTTQYGHVTDIQSIGVKNDQFNPILFGVAMGAGFVARGFSGEPDHLKGIMKQAIEYKGYALVDILQPCVSFNKINTLKWYKDRVYTLEDDYDYESFENAINKSTQWGDKIPIGIIYKKDKIKFADQYEFLKNGAPLVYKDYQKINVEAFMNDFL